MLIPKQRSLAMQLWVAIWAHYREVLGPFFFLAGFAFMFAVVLIFS